MTVEGIPRSCTIAHSAFASCLCCGDGIKAGRIKRSSPDEPLQPSYVRTLLPRLAREAGLDKRVHPHGLRHTLPYELMMEGGPAPTIQQQLGHTSLKTTSRYLDHLAPTEVIDRMQSREWNITY